MFILLLALQMQEQLAAIQNISRYCIVLYCKRSLLLCYFNSFVFFAIGLRL